MNTFQKRLFTAGFLAVTVTLAAGSQAHAQASGTDRTFQLSSVNGAQLPAVVEEESGCREELVSATLVLSATGRWTLTSNERETCGNDVKLDKDTDIGMFRLEGQTVQFMDIDGDIPATRQAGAGTAPDEIEVDELSVGTLSGNTLTARLTDGHTVLVFQQ